MNPKLLNAFKDYTMITIGIILVALGLEYFHIPHNIAAGGVSGLAIIINSFLPQVPVGAIILTLNLVLFLVAFLTLGGGFGAKTLYASFGMSLFMWVVERFYPPVILTEDLFINAAVGTIIIGIGMSLVFNFGASTGGTDILAKILSKYFHFDIGKSLLLVDFFIGLGGVLTFGITAGLYALLCIIFNGALIDRFIDGFNTAKELMIISRKEGEIIDFIIHELDRSCTVLNGYGGYTSEDIQVLYAVLYRRDYIRLRNFIREIDPRAFISVNEVHEVLGEGFKDIKL
ncbi:YitT family protein [Proteiniclasticum sp. BAD-10]|uniref:YitT family protein n=1 Tax=Proteiniclasticum sediminis TaxID=2804028 RepID=A0A941CQJ9_9CLOT|nr:YitT family protein [Proteiniclasticum sediminis]MBR0577070.1 YitT family protein [Proteiniclasticum sediminis]